MDGRFQFEDLRINLVVRATQEKSDVHPRAGSEVWPSPCSHQSCHQREGKNRYVRFSFGSSTELELQCVDQLGNRQP